MYTSFYMHTCIHAYIHTHSIRVPTKIAKQLHDKLLDPQIKIHRDAKRQWNLHGSLNRAFYALKYKNEIGISISIQKFLVFHRMSKNEAIIYACIHPLHTHIYTSVTYLRTYIHKYTHTHSIRIPTSIIPCTVDYIFVVRFA